MTQPVGHHVGFGTAASADLVRFVAEYDECAGTGRPSVVGPTGAPDELFGIRLVGEVEGRSAADMVTPDDDADPGWLMPMTDLLLARSLIAREMAFGDTHSGCVTVRFDFTFDPTALARAGRVRGLGRQAFVTGALGSSSCELRGEDDAVVATGIGLFVLNDSGVPDPVAAEPATKPQAHSLATLLDLDLDADAGQAIMPVGPVTANPSGIVHGGVQAAAVCAAMAAVASARIPIPMQVVTFGVEFAKPLVSAGEPICIRVVPRRIGRTFAVLDAEICGPSGTVGTRATATLTCVAADVGD